MVEQDENSGARDVQVICATVKRNQEIQKQNWRAESHQLDSTSLIAHDP